MQNKKVKHRPSTKYLYFHKITGPILFFSGEKRKKVSLTYRPIFFFSMLVETASFLLRLLYLKCCDGQAEANSSDPYHMLQKPYVFGQSGLSEQCRPRSDAADAASDLGPHCLSLIKQF